MVNFTKNDILLYINNKMKEETAIKFETELQINSSINEQYEQLLQANNAMQTPLLKPSYRVVNKILAYANQSFAEKAF
jgi:hypothetical protein